jgi:hypothetical protein
MWSSKGDGRAAIRIGCILCWNHRDSSSFVNGLYLEGGGSDVRLQKTGRAKAGAEAMDCNRFWVSAEAKRHETLACLVSRPARAIDRLRLDSAAPARRRDDAAQDAGLAALYGKIVAEPVPPRLTALIAAATRPS